MERDHSANIRIGIIGGTGLGEVLLAQMNPSGTQSHRLATPFGEPSSAIITGRHESVDIAFLQRHGEGHVLNPSTVPYRANIFALKQLGCTHILASGATGSLREEIKPGDVVICDQLIDRTVARPRTFYERAAVHVEFADPMCAVMRQWLITASESLPAESREPRAEGREPSVHHRGTYICIEGPSFSTRAESEMHRQWGADVVGMTALPEARLAREAEMAYVLMALPTDFDCWRSESIKRQNAQTSKGHPATSEDISDHRRSSPVSPASLIEEIIANLNRATSASIALMKEALTDVTILRQTPSPAHRALDLAIWSDKSRINPAEVERLRPLWGRHFE